MLKADNKLKEMLKHLTYELVHLVTLYELQHKILQVIMSIKQSVIEKKTGP